MADLYKIDVEELAFTLGIKFEEAMLPPPAAKEHGQGEQSPPPTDGKPPKKFQLWDGEVLRKTLDTIAKMDTDGNDLLLEGQVPSWVIAAIASRYPHVKVYNYVYYLEKAVHMPRLPMCGDTSEENGDPGGMSFLITIDGDRAFLQYIADSPDSHEHSYDYSKLPMVRAPYIEPGKHVYIAGHGATFVQVSVALAYANTAKSVFLAFHGGNGTPGTKGSYNCAITNSPEVKLGESFETIIPPYTNPQLES